MNTQTRTEAYKPADLRTNHDRAEKTAAKLNGNRVNYAPGSSNSLVRYTADCQPGKTAVLVVERRPYGSGANVPFTEALRVETRIDDKIGNPVTYKNRYTTSNIGSMCWRVEEAEKQRQASIGGLRALESRLLDAREEVARLEKLVADRQQELGL
jgi:hypothetical protein